MSLLQIFLIHTVVLLIVFQLKHFVMDFPLQTPYMLGKFKAVGWFKPLLLHANMHAVMTLLIANIYFLGTGVSLDLALSVAFGCAVADLIIHAIVDYWKAQTTRKQKLTSRDPAFWNLIGIDQMAHHFTHYVIVSVLLITRFGMV